MTWHVGGMETDLTSGRRREVVVVFCDAAGCHASEAVGRHGDNVEKIQRLLMNRGWGWTDVADGGRDLCPSHVEAVAS